MVVYLAPPGPREQVTGLSPKYRSGITAVIDGGLIPQADVF
jgi:hypothetical protein